MHLTSSSADVGARLAARSGRRGPRTRPAANRESCVPTGTAALTAGSAGQPAPRTGRAWVIGSSSGVAGRGERASSRAPGTRQSGRRGVRGAPESSLLHTLRHDLHGRATSDGGWDLRGDPIDGQAVRHQPCARAHASFICAASCPTPELGEGRQPWRGRPAPTTPKQPLSTGPDGVPLPASSSVCG